MTLLGTTMRGEKMADYDYMDEAATHFGTFTAPDATRFATVNSIGYAPPSERIQYVSVRMWVDDILVEEEMMVGKGYCADCKKEADISYCKYWWRDDSPAAGDPFHKTCCECGGSNVEFLVGPLAINTDVSVTMEKLEAIWHTLNQHCLYSLSQTLALILPSALGGVAFSDEEFNEAMDEVLASWDNNSEDDDLEDWPAEDWFNQAVVNTIPVP